MLNFITLRRFGALLGLSLLPALASAAVNIEHWSTPSGVRVYLVENHALPMVDLELDFAAGDALDPPGKASRAGMLADMLAAGADGRDEEAIANTFADVGAVYSARSEGDRLVIDLRTLSDEAQRDTAVLQVHALLTRPEFPDAVLAREKSRTIAGLKESETRPGAVAQRCFMAAIYPEHPYGVPTTEATVAALQREDLVEAWKQGIVTRRAVLSLVGDLTRAQAEALVARLFDGMPEGQAAPPLPPLHAPQAQTQRIPNPSAQAHIVIGLPGISRDDPDYFPLLVGNYVLGGGGFASRLTDEVREKRGYAYSVSSSFLPMALRGPFGITLQTKGSQTDAALKVVDDTLQAFLREGPTASELKAAQDYIVNGYGLRLDSNRKVLGYLGVVGFYDLPLDWLDRYPDEVRAVTLAQVRDAFQRRIRLDQLVTVVVGGDGDRAQQADGRQP